MVAVESLLVAKEVNAILVTGCHRMLMVAMERHCLCIFTMDFKSLFAVRSRWLL
jgi:hypothetical protein